MRVGRRHDGTDRRGLAEVPKLGMTADSCEIRSQEFPGTKAIECMISLKQKERIPGSSYVGLNASLSPVPMRPHLLARTRIAFALESSYLKG